MGVGDSLEAAFTLAGPISAGTWHLVGDGIVQAPVDVQYDVIWRHAGSDSTLASFQHHFDPLVGANHFDATMYDANATGLAATARPGDLLVLRFTASGPADGGSAVSAFIPNGDGAHALGRIPSITLPR